MDNEEWVESSGSFCNPNCPWVEAGYSTFGSGEAETLDYFYAYSSDGTFRKPCCYHEYVLGQVASVDYGTSTTVQVERGGSNFFDIYVVSTGANYFVTTGSTPETANQIEIGQEAYYVDTGTVGPEAFFTNNIWFDGGYGQHY